MKKYAITLDVGGTSIKSAVISQSIDNGKYIYHQFLESTYSAYSSKSSEDRNTIIDNLITIICEKYNEIDEDNFKISSISFGFPGPFDYDNGISFIKGIGKFDSIYGVNIKQEIKKRLTTLNLSKLSADVPIVFENDATVFAIGENYSCQGQGYDRVICITLGTGCGSAFLQNGKIVKGEMGVPTNGMIFDAPFRDSIVDNYISRRYILSLAKDAGFDMDKMDVKELTEYAYSGDTKALNVFSEFGHIIGEVLKPYIQEFNADMILFGGQISKAYPIIQSAFQDEIYPYKPKVVISKSLSKSALIGCAIYANSLII